MVGRVGEGIVGVAMAGRQASLRLRGRSDGNAQGRRLVILACTMAGILFFLSLHHSSFSGHRSGRAKTLQDTHVDWSVARAAVATKDPFVEPGKGLENVGTGDLEEKVGAIRVDEKEEMREEEKEEEKEEKDEQDEKEAMEEPEDKDDDGNDGIEKEEGHFEGLALGDEATSNEDESSEEEAGDDGILQATPKSFPVSLVGFASLALFQIAYKLFSALRFHF